MTRRATQFSRRGPGFSLIEVLVVVLVIGILAAVSMPVVSGAMTDSRSSNGLNAVVGIRASISSFRTRATIAGADPFPTLAELTTPGDVLDRPIPENPWTGLSDVRLATSVEAAARTVVSEGTYGWAYYFDNASTPPVAIFYANCADDTSRVDGSDGTFLSANEL